MAQETQSFAQTLGVLRCQASARRGLGPVRPRVRPNADNQQRRDQKGHGIDQQGRLCPQLRRHQAAGDGAARQHCRPGYAPQRVGQHQPLPRQQGGQQGIASRLKEGRQGELQRREQIDQPQQLRSVRQQEQQHHYGAQDIAEYEKPLAVQPVDEHAGPGPDQHGGHKAGQQKQADGQARTAAVCFNQYSQNNRVEPVAQQADDLRQPQTGKIRVVAQQAPVGFHAVSTLPASPILAAEMHGAQGCGIDTGYAPGYAGRMQPSTLVSIGAGGLLGACARHLFGLWILTRLGVSNPVSTMIINIVGSLLLGLFLGLSLKKGLLPLQVRLFVTVGFCGAFTTFSTYAYESVAQAREGQWLAMAGNILGNNLLCLAGVGLGLALASRL